MTEAEKAAAEKTEKQKAAAAKLPADSRTVVLTADVDKVGKEGERVRVPAKQAAGLIGAGKARMATLQDFGR